MDLAAADVTTALPFRRPEPLLDGEVDQPVLVALVVALVLLIPMGTRPGGETLAAVAAVAGVLFVATRWRVAPLAIGVLLVVGVGLRAAIETHFGSDVIDVIASAIRHVEIGENPYGVGYTASRPEGAPYAYGPLALLWYGPLQNDGWQLELFIGCVVLTLLALRGKLLGLAIYATSPVLVAINGDGSNDTSGGFLLLAAFIVARRRPALGAVLLAAAVAFKPYAAAWAPAFMVWAGWGAIVAFGAASLVLWSPVIFVWGLPSFLKSLDMANRVHNFTYWSFGELLQSVTHHTPVRDVLDNLRLVLGTVTAVITLRWARSLDGVILAGTLVYLVTLYMGFWSTPAYFAGIGPVLCWRIDDWLHLPTRPLVELPGDIEGRTVAAT
ncbi:MAG: hypothetical protein HY263_07085 [Chloroflexi bacterium]|nr:hypothetical protein [Chloroflexota bacterium]